MFNPNFHQYLDHPVTKKVLASGPKRILALDGGGVRGALTIGFLEKMEALLIDRYEKDIVLADYFDLIGGTSTGSIIATLLAKGWKVKAIKDLYLNLGKTIFSKKVSDLAIGKTKYLLAAQYDESILEEELTNHLREDKLGSAVLRTGLVIFTKRADTYSIYGFHNHPRGAYYESNKDILLKDLLRASSAAPSFFKPKEIEFSDGGSGVFIDGCISGVNNPSLMLFLMSTIKGYGYQWRTGAENMLLISVGTGYHKPRATEEAKKALLTKSAMSWAADLPEIFMVDAAEHNMMMMQYMSQSMLPEYINGEVEYLKNDLLTPEPLLVYSRYNSLLDKDNLKELGKEYSEEEIKELRKMENGEKVNELYEIGRMQAENLVDAAHFPPVFDYGMVPENRYILSQSKALEAFLPILDSIGNVYEKYRTIYAREATKEEVIVSITSFGKETKNTAYPGAFIVTNQTEAKEQYVVKKEKFASRYTLLEQMEDGNSLYKAIGKVIGIEITTDVLKRLNIPVHYEIIAVWNEYQYMTKGDYLVCPLDKSEVYRISRKEFFETYKPENS